MRTLRKAKDAGLAKQCHILLLRDRGWTYRLIAETVEVLVGTVQWRLQCYKGSGQASLISSARRLAAFASRAEIDLTLEANPGERWPS